MITAYIVVVALALLPQVVFSVVYWWKIPSWIKNPYGRLAQFGAWCHIIFLGVVLVFLTVGRQTDPHLANFIFLFSFFPLIAYGVFQLFLLKKAIEESRKEEREREYSDS